MIAAFFFTGDAVSGDLLLVVVPLVSGLLADLFLIILLVTVLLVILLLIIQLLVVLLIILQAALLVVPGFAASARALLVSASVVIAPVVLVVLTASVAGSAGGVAGAGGHYGCAGEGSLHSVGVVLHYGYRLCDKLLDIAEKFSFFFVAEGKGGAVCARSAGAAYAMNVGFRYVGQFEVDDVGQFVDIDAAGGDVCCNEDPCLSAFKVEERSLAGVLRLVTVDRFGADAGSYESLGYFVGAVFGAREDQCRWDGGCFQDMQQQRFFVLLFDEIEGLLYRLGGG